ncbi:monocarboxylate transporter 9-like [Epargyreus clarus]|uniref:monocarboxylate transporter 9-like n=1 Tax=Epargyreus clarus TaxID=520877 RepID=UPI003C2D75E9
MEGNEQNGSVKNVIGDKGNEDLNKVNALKLENKEIAEYRVQYDNKSNDSKSVTEDRVKFEGISDKDSICSEELPPIPDGGWGWVVVFAAFMTATCADGLAYSFGILHQEFIIYFAESQSKTSLIGSLFVSIPLLSGPIMSALVDRYGCRIMTITASVISTFGFLLAAVSNSVEIMCLTLGVISGLSMGVLYVTSVVAVAFWFDKRRTLAVSLASCGIGFGTFIYSPMTEFFVKEYAWRSTLILLAGTILNVSVCGALLRDPDWIILKEQREKKVAKTRSRKSSSAGSISSKSIGGESMFLSADELNDLVKSGKSPEFILATLTSTLAEAEQLEATTQMNAEITHKRVHSDVALPTFIQGNEQVPAEVIEKLMSNKRIYNILVQAYPHVIQRRKSDVNLNVEEAPQHKNNPAQLPVTVKAKKPVNKVEKLLETKEIEGILKVNVEPTPKVDVEIAQKPENIIEPVKESKIEVLNKNQNKALNANWTTRRLSTGHHYLRDVPIYKNTIVHRGAMLNIPRYKLRASSLPNIYKNSYWSVWSDSDDERKWYDRVIEVLKETFDFKVFTELHFLVINIASLLMSLWSIIPYFFLASFMVENKMEGSAVMISVIGIASGFGIILLGWAGDQPWFNVTKAYAICLLICGLSVAVMPFVITNYWPLIIVSAVFGLSFASSYSYTPAILMELVPIDYFTMGYGMILLSQGIGHLIGPPLGGLMYDVSGSWDLTFHIGGLWIIISGGCVGIIPYTNNMRLCGKSPLLKEAEEAKSRTESLV